MKKVLLTISIILLIILIGFGIYYFFGNGKDKVNNFFTDNSFGSFFDANPQSQNDFTDTPLDVPNEEQPQNTSYSAPILRQISFEPISGYTYYSTTSTSTRTSLNPEGQELLEEFLATSTVVRFQERATGHIYDVFEFLQAPQKISNITKPKIYYTQFSSNKDQYVFSIPSQDYEQIQTTYAKLSFSTTTGVSIVENQLSNTISDFVLNKDSNKLIYSFKQNGSSSLYISNLDRTGEKLIKVLPFNEFLIEAINTTDVLITTKASFVSPGYSYILNTSTGAFNKILGNINGLTVKVSPDEKYYIYSQSEQNRPSVRLYNKTIGTTNLITLDTIPSEKCVYSKKELFAYCFGSIIYKAGEYPDDWYKGKLFNQENLYKVNLTNGQVSAIYNFGTDNLTLDAQNVQITNKDEFIIFQNKYDLTLWSLNLMRLENGLD
ncbi:MAG: hypothetical protein RLZZ517_414 [Candidatus Parcubacteria bacterium]|jgi:hypothetical protein